MDETNALSEIDEVLHKRSLSDEVYDFLSRKIIAGKYASGDWLRQEDISTQLGVSQTPVREAFDRLVASGLAEKVPYRGVRVPALVPKEIVDAFILRLVLEVLATRLISTNISAEEIQKLLDIVAKTENLLSLEDMSTLRQLNKEFHKTLVDTAGNSLLSKMYEMVTNSFPDWMMYEYLFRHPEVLQSSLKREYKEHKAIVDALASNDPETATYQVAEHLLILGEELGSYLDISANSIHELELLIKPLISTHHNNTSKSKGE